MTFDIKTNPGWESGKAIFGYVRAGPIFGVGFDIYIGWRCGDPLPENKSLCVFNKSSYCWNGNNGYSYNYGDDYISLSGSTRQNVNRPNCPRFFQVIDYYVFKIDHH